MKKGVNIRKRFIYPSERHARSKDARKRRTAWLARIQKVQDRRLAAVSGSDIDWKEINDELNETAAHEKLDAETIARLLRAEKGTPAETDKAPETEVRKQPAAAAVKKEENEPKKPELTRKQLRRERKWQAREAEIDALISRKQYSFKGLLLHPYKCMTNEFYEEIPGSVIGSLIRMFVKWAIFAAFFAEEIKKLIDAGSFSNLRVSFSTTAAMGFRIALMLCAAELLLYLLHFILSICAHQKIAYNRLLSSGTMCWVMEAIGYLIAGIIGLCADPVIGMLLLFAVLLFGLMLKNQALIDATGLSHEIVTALSIFIVFISGVVIVRVIGLTETEIIRLLVIFYS